MILAGIAVAVLLASTAAASAFITRETLDDVPAPAKSQHVAKRETIQWNESKPAPQPQQVAEACDDGNVVGAIIGGVGGGVLGSQIGNGNGKTAATIGGTLGGGYLGKEYIPTRNATCR